MTRNLAPFGITGRMRAGREGTVETGVCPCGPFDKRKRKTNTPKGRNSDVFFARI